MIVKGEDKMASDKKGAQEVTNLGDEKMGAGSEEKEEKITGNEQGVRANEEARESGREEKITEDKSGVEREGLGVKGGMETGQSDNKQGRG